MVIKMDVKRSREAKRKGYLSSLVIILVGTIISFVGFEVALSWDRQMIRTEFEGQAENYFETIKKEIESNLHTVMSLKALFDNIEQVDRSEFRDFVGHHLSINPSIQAIEWIPCVPHSERMAYEAAARQNGLSDFRITERDAQGKITRAAERGEYFPVYFVEPYNGNKIALGFDLASDSMRRQALEKSRDTGEMVATGRITLVQETAGQFGFLVFAPVYNKGVTADSIKSRRENLKGFALGVFRIGDIVENSLTRLHPEGIDVYLYDKSAASREESFLYFQPSRTEKPPLPSTLDRETRPDDHLEKAKTLNIANREWVIVMKSTSEFASGRKTWQPFGFLTSGLLLTAILTSYLIARKRAEGALRESEQHYRSLFDNMLNGFAYCRMLFEQDRPKDFIYLNVNGAFETLTGLKDVVGKKVSEVIPGIQESNPELFEIYGRVALYGIPEQFEIYVNTLEMWFSISVYSPQREYFVTIFDVITNRKLAEQEIHRLNRLYDLLSQVNQAIVHIKSRDELLSTVCRLTVERGAIDLAWIGWLDPETARIDPVAFFGNQAEMLSESHFYANDQPEGQGNPGKSIREGKPFVCNECGSSPCLYPSGQAPVLFGFKSCGSFPLRFRGDVCGVFSLCVGERGFFQERETELMEEVALDISFALDKIDGDSERERLKEEFQEQSMLLQSLIEGMPCQVFYKDTQMRYLGCNKAYERLLGLDRDQIIGRTSHDIWPEDLADLYSRADRQLLANPDQQSTAHEEIVETPEGIRRHYLTNKAIFRSQEGAIGGIIGTTMDITERRVAEAAIQKSEAKFRSYIENSPLAVLVADREGCILDFNRAAIDFLGYDAETLASMNLNKIVPDEDHEILFDDFATLLNKGHLQTERRVKKADGEVRWVAVNVSMIDDQLSLGYFQDITERKWIEDSLRDNERRLRTILQTANEGFWLKDNDGVTVDVNPRMCAILGRDREEMIGRKTFDFVDSKNKAIFEQQAKLREQGVAYAYEIALSRPDGSHVFCRLSATPLFDGSGNKIGAFAMVTDITGQKRAEKALRESEEQFKAIFELAAVGIAQADAKTQRWLRVNRKMCEITGYSCDQLLAMCIPDITHPEDRQLHREVFEIIPGVKAKDYSFEKRYIRRDGSIMWANVHATTVRDPTGQPIFTYAAILDITEARKAEMSLQRAYTEMAQVLASIPSFLIGLTADNKIMRWNSAAEKTFGIESAAVLGKPFDQCGIQWDWEKISEAVSICQTGTQSTKLDNFRFAQADGRERFLWITFSPIGGAANDPPGTLLLGADITERKVLESQLTQTQKLESIGQLAAGIAHEINTPAQYVGDNTRFLQEVCAGFERVFVLYDQLIEHLKSREQAKKFVEKIEKTAQQVDLDYIRDEAPKAILQSLDGIGRISKIVRAMKEFSHPGADTKTAIDLNKAIESTITVARNEWKYVAEMETDLDPSLPPVPCLPAEINQVILNMIINASHAIADVVKKNGPEGKGTIKITSRARDNWAEISISDTGAGIPENIRSRIFDPFFTTKEVGKGTGQGLAISHSVVVDKHGGTITFDSELGKGSVFVVRLPLDLDAKTLSRGSQAVRTGTPDETFTVASVQS